MPGPVNRLFFCECFGVLVEGGMVLIGNAGWRSLAS